MRSLLSIAAILLGLLALGSSSRSQPGKKNALPPDAWKDKEVRKLIKEWVNLATKLRDENDPKNAPHRISPYGPFLSQNNLVVPEPDQWEKKYQKSYHAFLWLNFAHEHLDLVYRDKLPPLHEFVKDRLGNMGNVAKKGPPAKVPNGPATPVKGMTLIAEERNVRPKELVVIAVWLRKSTDLASLNFDVKYDAAVAVPEGKLVKGNMLAGALFSGNPKERGIVHIGVAGNVGLKGDGIVAFLPFRAVGPPGSFTPLELMVTTSANNKQGNLDVATINGSIRIMAPGDHVKGDCNGDGILDARDAQCALDMSTKLIPEDLNLDMDNSNSVTAVDATLILQARALALLKK